MLGVNRARNAFTESPAARLRRTSAARSASVMLRSTALRHEQPDRIAGTAFHLPDGYEAEVFLDAQIAIEQAFHCMLIVKNVPRDELHQIVIAAGHQKAVQDMGDILNAAFEPEKIFAPMVVQRHLGED